jgi:hypothetical protein
MLTSAAFTVTISACVISTYTMTGGSVLSSNTYTIGATAVVITLPTFTQNPLCGYTETKSCFKDSSPTACPIWVTTTQTTWTISCNNPTTCPAGIYNLVL